MLTPGSFSVKCKPYPPRARLRRSVADGLVGAASAVAPVHQNSGAADLNSSVAGKLNILLLAVRARMVDALLDVLNATGEALSIPREDDETALAFASRLAAAIQKLPTGEDGCKSSVSFAMQGQAVPLRLLANRTSESCRTGSRPHRHLSRNHPLQVISDLAARAVVRSYGQNDASPLRREQRTGNQHPAGQSCCSSTSSDDEAGTGSSTAAGIACCSRLFRCRRREGPTHQRICSR